MTILKLTLICCLCFGNLLSSARGQSDIQHRVDTLNIGTSNLDDVKRVFGEPASQREGLTYQEGFRNGTLDALYMEKTLNRAWVQQDIKSGQLIVRQTRTIHDLAYAEQGLIITMLDNPWQVNALTITNKNVDVFGIRVGDRLSKVKTLLGKGEWLTTDVKDWWVEYEAKGVRYYFRADPKSPKYPMKLAKDKTVLRIEKYDTRVSFS
jgi:hypothetical protein